MNRSARTTSVAFYMDADAWPGGAERWLSMLMAGLQDAGWAVALFLTDKRATDAWALALAERGVAVTRVRPTREIDRSGVRESEKLFAGFPLVHVNKAHPRACLPAIAGARRAGARAVVVSEHVVAPPRSRYPFGAAAVKRLVRKAGGICDAITVPSEASREEYLSAYGADPGKVLVVRGAVDLSLFEAPTASREVRRSLGLGENDRAAAIVGRLHSGKGLETAIEAVPLVLAGEPLFRLVIVGAGGLEPQLREMRRKLGLESSVIMAGPRDDVPAILRSVDLLVVASESETSGLVAMEAAAAGKPVVATRAGGLAETVTDGVTGLLVPPRDEVALAGAMVELLGDARKALAMGGAARERALREFGTGHLVDTMSGIYDALLASGGAER